MAKRDSRTPEQQIRQLELELEDKERELIGFKQELGKINQELERFIQQVDGELKLAALIQRALVPTEIPTIPGFIFSTKFVASSLSGGDYFDIFEHRDQMRFGLLMANSSGHGMASLFLSVLLKLTTQIEAKKGLEPNEVLHHMAKELKTSIKSSDEANIFYAVIDRRTYQLSFSRAGSVGAYLYKKSLDKLVRLETGNAPMGAESSKTTYKVETINLDPRDKLVVVTSGAINVKNKEGEIFGEERLFEIILEGASSTRHELRNEILFQISKFADGEPYSQDISTLVMEVKDKVIKLRKG